MEQPPLKKLLKNWYQKALSCEQEQQKVLAFVRQLVPPSACILDVACGYGRYLKPLQQLGFNVLGVEKNETIVQQNCAQGLRCVSVEAFKQMPQQQFDLIILSHIIEHFAPNDLLVFLDDYLGKLKQNGYLLIATPLYSPHFYDDFDHVKPYHPAGLQMVFGGTHAQVQYYSSHQIVLKKLWFRKSPLLSSFHPAKHFKTGLTRMFQLYDLLMTFIFKASGSLIGRKDGWVGVFQKN